MSTRANEQTVVELTRVHRNPANRINSKTELRGNQDGKWTVKQFVLSGYGIYSVVIFNLNVNSFDPVRTDKPQRNRYLGDNSNGGRMKNYHPFSRLATIQSLSGVGSTVGINGENRWRRTTTGDFVTVTRGILNRDSQT